MKTKLFYFSVFVLASVCIKAQMVDVKVYDDCSKNGYTKSICGTAAVDSSAGRTSCDYVQLWENGPKWATFNVGATITDYAQLTIGADATTFYHYTDQASYYNTANIGGLYAWNNPNLNGRKTTWTCSVTTGISDVATALWGSNWKTPTKEQLDTLQNSSYGKTSWTWCDGSTTQYVAGCTLKGYKVSGVGDYANYSIFLPAGGYFICGNSAVIDASNKGHFWSSTESRGNCGNALIFSSDYRGVSDDFLGGGPSVRAVLANNPKTSGNVKLTLMTDGCDSVNVITCPIGQQLRITAEATLNGSKFSKWSDGNTDNPRVIIISQDTTISAYFELTLFHVTALSDDTTLGYVIGGGDAYINTKMLITAACSTEGYHFTHWSDGSTVPGRKIKVKSDSTLIAYFAEDTPAECVTVDVNNPSLGSADIQIVATPASGATFTNWSDGNTDNPRIVTDAPDNYIAVFVSTPTNARATKASTNDPEKIILDNQLYILRDGKTYNAQGGEVR